MNWYKQSKVMPIDPEEDWESAEQADQVFNQTGIRYDRSKNISQVAVEDGQVIGALASGWTQGEEYENKPIHVYAFDLAVQPQHQRRGVGMKLISEAVRTYESERHMYEEAGGVTMMRLWVVNPILVPLLETQFGFKVEADYGQGGVHMVRY